MSGSSIEGIHVSMNRRAGNVQSQLRQDEYANLIVSLGLPKYTDLGINAKIYTANTLTGTAAAPAIAPLTTNAQHVLHNGSTAAVYLIPLRAWVTLESGTRGIGSSVWVASSRVAESTAPTEYASSSGTAGLTSGAATGVGLYDGIVTLGTAPKWICWAAEDRLADLNESSSIVLKFDGEFVIAPLHNFVMSIRDAVAGSTPLYSAGFMWAEVALTLP